MGKSYITELENHSLTEENLIDVKKKMLIGNIRMLIIFLVLSVVTIAGIPRIKIFIRIFSNVSYAFQIVGIVLYLVSLTFLVIYYLSVTIYILANIKNNDYWVYIVYKTRKRFDLISFTCKCLSLFLFLLIFILNPCTVDGSSMSPTFESNDKVVCTDLFYYPKKGDVVVFDASKYTNQDELYIKRVVAVEGDIISYSNGILYVNRMPEERQEVSYSEYELLLLRVSERGGVIDNDTAIIPNGMVVVFGDNRTNSYDSRKFGPININDIYGKVIVRVFPFTNVRFF